MKDNISGVCPKCNSRFGVILSSNKSEVICFNGDCDFSMNIVEWNRRLLQQPSISDEEIDNGRGYV